jgi:hypothetical protein
VFGAWSHSRVRAADSWPTVQGVIDSSSISTSRSRRGRTTYRCKVAYHFVVNGTTWTGDRMDPMGISSSSRSSAEENLRKYPALGPCTVHYDPADPARNCLELGSTTMSWAFLGFGLLMFLGGGVAMARAFLPSGHMG